MPTTIEEEREYNDLVNMVDSVLFVFGLFLTMGCCMYCIIKKEEYKGIDEIETIV